MLRLCTSPHERGRSLARRRALTSCIFVTILAAILNCVATATATAQPKESRHDRDAAASLILAIASLNFDCYPDTVLGLADEQFHYLPTEIHWGAAPERADSACASETPKKKRERVTTIRYPNWKRITGSVSFERMNADTLTDIVLYLWGDAGNDDNGRARAPHDSLRALVLFGQMALDSVKQINLASIAPFQSEPYFAMELRPGADLRDEKKRDLSGTPSYEVKRVTLDVRGKKDTTDRGPAAPPLAGIAREETSADVHIYPNPSAAETRIEADRLSPGAYTIELVAVNGTVALRQEVVVSESRGLLRSLDVRGLASGYYLLRLRGGNAPESGENASRWTGTYPIIIAR